MASLVPLRASRQQPNAALKEVGLCMVVFLVSVALDGRGDC
jgi:hypothetical protein